MPNYFYKSKSVFLEEGNTKVHKQLAEMKGKRCVWLDELSKKKQNSELMKELADGKKIENEVMYGTSEAINILFKLNGLSNFKPKIEADQQATYNRYKQISYHSHFDRSGQRKVANPETLEFIADPHLTDKLLNDYKQEIFQLLIDYACQYGEQVYNEDKQEWKMRGLPPIPLQFREEAEQTKQSNDDFGKWFEDNLEMVEDGRVSKYEILQNYKKGKEKVNETEVVDGMKRKGYKFDKELKGFETKKTYDGKIIKGGWKGVRFIRSAEEAEESDSPLAPSAPHF
jgi:phage/plasmid-associated DNA primase